MEKNSKSLHIVMFPWLAMGHLIPFLQLSKILALKGHRVSFISTPRNIQRLPKIPSHLSPLLTLITFKFPQLENLPHRAESSMDISHHTAQFLRIAFDLLQPQLADFLQNTNPKPDWIVYDYASHWVPPLASKFGVLRGYFSLFSAATMAFLGPPSAVLNGDDRLTAEAFTVVPKWVPFQSDVVYRLHEVMKYFEGAVGNESGTSDTVRFAASIDGSDLVLFRTCVEFEPEWFNLVCELYRKPVVPVGVLPPMGEEDDELDENEKWFCIKEWLDKQSIGSVVYVALGSEAALSEDELSEFALGLVKSGSPFFWVLTKPPGSGHVTLPNGFEAHGVVHLGWGPQVKILSHPAIGGFLTHCGWNSVIEGLTLGRVLIFFPVMNDQGLNTRLLHGKKLGVEVLRDERDGSFTSDSVANSIKCAMVGKEGESMRANASRMRDFFGDKKKNDCYIHNFVVKLIEMRASR